MMGILVENEEKVLSTQEPKLRDCDSHLPRCLSRVSLASGSSTAKQRVHCPNNDPLRRVAWTRPDRYIGGNQGRSINYGKFGVSRRVSSNEPLIGS